MAGMRGEWSAIVLTGGTAVRLGGIDKATIQLGPKTALEHLLTSLPAQVPVVIAGPPTPTPRDVLFAAEDPPQGGPVAGLAAASAAVSTSVTAIVAVDMPWAGPLLARLVDELADADVIVPVDADDRRQYLCCAWRTASLRSALNRIGNPRDASMRSLFGGCAVREWPVPGEWTRALGDIDDDASLAAARERAGAPTLRYEDT
ncbi:MAG: NTP transferase domain-containing protein [Actinomycetales bacterium]|nr:NTP transferase domain-containing protein [Actinomycetales bacterium]